MILEKVRKALRITTTALDDEIQDVINAAYADLGIVGISTTDEEDPVILNAVKTYCKLNFGTVAPAEFDRLKDSYFEQKAQLRSSSEYTRRRTPVGGGGCDG